MLRLLRAFAWMRWRVLLNSLERTGARDTLQRLSLAIEQIGPLIALALLAPSALALAMLGGYAGYALAALPDETIPIEVLRYLLLGASAFCIVGPIVLPASERTNAVRLLLLPIPRHLLYVVQSASALTEPWILLTLPAILSVPIGITAGGSVARAAAAAAAGLLLAAVLVGLTSLVTSITHLLLRDRRRGELVALVFIVVVPVIGMMPALLGRMDAGGDARLGDSHPLLDRLLGAAVFAFRGAPSELYTSVLTSGNAPALLGLAFTAALLHGVGLVAFGRLLDGPASGTARRGPARDTRWSFTLPGVSRAASAVALNQWRLALRTPRGRAMLLTPIPVVAVFGGLMRQAGGAMDFGFLSLDGGVPLALFGTAVSLLAVLPFSMNQFAIDRAGLTLQFLSPLRNADILVGKAIGIGFTAAVPVGMCLLISLAFFPDTPAAIWLAIPAGAVATYALAAPAAAIVSALLPRSVDLNAIGSASNAHGLAGLVGLLAYAFAGLPAVALGWITFAWAGAAVVPLAIVIWCAVSLALSRALLQGVARLVEQRRENLALVA